MLPMASRLVHLISVNKTPARAAMLVHQLLQSLDATTDVVHVANASCSCLSTVQDALTDTKLAIGDIRTLIGALVVAPEIMVAIPSNMLTKPVGSLTM